MKLSDEKFYTIGFDPPMQRQWSSNSLGALMRCPRYHYYTQVMGYRMRGDGFNIKALWGHAVHFGLEVYEKVLFCGHSFDQAVMAAVTTTQIKYGEQLRASEDTACTLDTALRTIVWYAEHYKDDPYGIMALPSGRPSVEIDFEFPIPTIVGYNMTYRGRVDIVKSFEGGIWIFDHKTTGKSLNEWYWKFYEPDLQMLGYMWAGSKLFGDRFRGVLVDGIQTLVSGTRFERYQIQSNPEFIEEFERTASQTLISYIGAHSKPVPRYPSCGLYGGCQFRGVCSRPESQRQAWLDSDFEQSGS